MTITSDQLPAIIAAHGKWLRGEDGGARANLAGAYLAGANLARANLEGAYLAGAYLAGAYLAGAYLARANLEGANLDGANLAGAYLAGAYLARANLARANLAGANLARANLEGANLARAYLAGANLDGAADSWAQCAFSGHGECGRMLTAIVLKKGDEPRLFCGCFTGSAKELRQYIKDGEARYRKTRTLALKTVLTLLKARNDD